MDISVIAKVMLPMAVLIFSGKLYMIRHGMERTGYAKLSFGPFIMDVLSPIAFFYVVAVAPLSFNLILIPLMLNLAIVVSLGFAYVLFYRVPFLNTAPPEAKPVLVVSVAFGNIFAVAGAMLFAIKGPSSVISATLSDILSTIPMIWTLGYWLCAKLSPHGGDVSIKAILIKLTKLPLMWGFALGLVWNLIGIKQPLVTDAAKYIAVATVPLILFLVGLSIPWDNLKPTRYVLAAIAVKLIVMPAATFGLLMLIGRKDLLVAGLLCAGVPTSATVLIFADMFKLCGRTAALVIAWGLVLYWAVVPVWLMLAKMVGGSA